ncbi:MAG: Lipoate-protein ligase LplJ [Candidatus Izimaplasma bacterium HR2]|nr:MAG: Lipoate-protein ligase LplJ [Candidatus Izimaplasma bacterium HR2]
MLTIINNETDPLYNLALEEYVFKHLHINEDILLIWQNKNSVIIGRDQNPFREVNCPYTHKNKIPMFRRLTFGETIYHDLGTINYSFIVRDVKENFDRYNIFLDPIVKILNELGVPSHLESDGDICLEGLRISANTQTYHRNKMIHHGVLFFNTNLEKLDQVIEIPTKSEFEYDIVKTKHNGITNIKEYLKEDLSIKQFKKYLLDKLIGEDLIDKQYKLDYIDKTKIKKIAKEKYSTWEWNYGESPKFIIKKEFDNRMMITLIVEKGIINRVSIDSFENVMALVKGLEGSRFDEKSLKERLRFCTTIDIDKLIETLLF